MASGVLRRLLPDGETASKRRFSCACGTTASSTLGPWFGSCRIAVPVGSTICVLIEWFCAPSHYLASCLMRGPTRGRPGVRSRRDGVGRIIVRKLRKLQPDPCPNARSCRRSSRTRSPRRQLKKCQELRHAPRCAEASCTPGGVWHLVRRGVTKDPKPNRKDSDARQQRRLRANRAESGDLGDQKA